MRARNVTLKPARRTGKLGKSIDRPIPRNPATQCPSPLTADCQTGPRFSLYQVAGHVSVRRVNFPRHASVSAVTRAPREMVVVGSRLSKGRNGEGIGSPKGPFLSYKHPVWRLRGRRFH